MIQFYMQFETENIAAFHSLHNIIDIRDKIDKRSLGWAADHKTRFIYQ